MRRRRSEKTKQKQGLNHGIKYRRKKKLQTPKNSQKPTSVSINPEIKKEVQDEKKDENGVTRFFGCYLLTSLSPRFKGHSYIGFTVNPKRRIRQHNGEITSGAFRTKKKRPWEMVLCIHGFPTNVAALQFEWAWQHPRESVAVREAAASFTTLGGLANKIKLALTMLNIHSWQSMNLTVSFFSTKYMKHAVGCPSLPPQMKLHFCSMDELPCYWNNDHPRVCDDEDDFDSNDSEVSANLSDDRLKYSTDDSMDMNLCSVHVESCTIQKSSDNIWEGDHIAIGGSLESESSSMMGTLEKHIQSSHQLPVDVSGSTLSSLDELLQPCDELWIEDVRGSSSGLEEHMQPVDGINASGDERFPDFEEKQPSCHILADVPASCENDLNEFLRFDREFWGEELRGSSPVTEDHLQPCQLAGPSDGQQSSMVGFVSSMEDVVKKDEVTCIVIDDMTDEHCQPTRAQSPCRFAKTVWPYSSEGIEVIELCTPSPDFRITRGSKKKRASSGFTDIIDLTRSPAFVQL